MNQKKSIGKYYKMFKTINFPFIKIHNCKKPSTKKKKINIRVYLPFSTRHIQFNDNHQVIPSRETSFMELTNFYRIFVHIFILISLYEAMIFDIVLICRYIYYLLKIIFGDDIDFDNKLFLKYIAEIFKVIELEPESSVFLKKCRSSAVGDFQINMANGNTHTFGNVYSFNILHCFNPKVDSIQLGPNIQFLLSVESDAGGKPFLNDARIKCAVMVDKILIVVETSGIPDIFTRFFLSYISKQYTKLIVLSLNDPDEMGFKFHKWLQNGSNNAALMNSRLTIPRLRLFGVFPFQFTSTSGHLLNDLNPKKRNIYWL